MGDRTNIDPIQDILEELHRIRMLKRELIVQLSAILCTGADNNPAPPRLPRICLIGPCHFHLPPKPVPEERDFVLNSIGNRLQLGDRVHFTGTARTCSGTGRVTGWTGPIQVPDPFIYIKCNIPPGICYVGSCIVHRKSHNVTLIGWQGS